MMKWFLTGDWHVPYHDNRALTAMLQALYEEKPTHIGLMGDLIDFYSLSHYLRNPSRIHRLQEDIDRLVLILHIVRNYAPQAKIYYLIGNHEDRLRRFLWRTPELVSLRALSLPILLNLEREKIELVPEPALFVSSQFVITHGTCVRKRSGYTAHAEIERFGLSGASGHTHRLAFITKRYPKQLLRWIETGCLCQLSSEYCPYPDWQHGYGIAVLSKSGELLLLEARLLEPSRKVLDSLPVAESASLSTHYSPALEPVRRKRNGSREQESRVF